MDIDLAALPPRAAHDLLTSALIPRPIAWVCSVDKGGRVNLAPFSFFSGVAWSPPTLCVSVVNRADGSRKDTVRNIEETGCFAVNMVTRDLAPRMLATAETMPRGADEAAAAGVEMVASSHIAAPRVLKAKVSFECGLDRIVPVGQGANAANLILGAVLLAHIDDGILTSEGLVDPSLFEVIGRVGGGTGFCGLGPVFDPKLDE